MLTEPLQTCGVWAEAPMMAGERAWFVSEAIEVFGISCWAGEDVLKVRERLVISVIS